MKFLIVLLIVLETLRVDGAESKIENVSQTLFKKPLAGTTNTSQNRLNLLRDDVNLNLNPPPFKISNQSPPLITAEGVLIIDVASNKVLYQKKANENFSIASLTKIMTALISLENYSLDDVVEVKQDIIGGLPGALINLQNGEKIKVSDLLYGLLLYSGNDAAYTLASKMGKDEFVKKMNEKAKYLGFSQTHYDDPSGLSPKNISTPTDLAHLAILAFRNPTFAKIVNTNEITIMSIDGKYVHPLKNTDKLLRDYPGTYGGKTGYTEEAGHSLIVAVERNNHKVISVVLKSQSDQFRESRWLLDYIFDVYRWSY